MFSLVVFFETGKSGGASNGQASGSGMFPSRIMDVDMSAIERMGQDDNEDDDDDDIDEDDPELLVRPTHKSAEPIRNFVHMI